MTSSEEHLHKIRDGRDLSPLDLTSIDQLSTQDMSLIFDLARAFRDLKTEKLSLNRSRSMINAFFEPSTRTMSSFDLSAKHLGMDTTNVSSQSSVKKGESFLDTIETLDSYNPAVIVVRAQQSGVPQMLARHARAAIINAGDGWHEHPTQALLDMLTMLDHFGSSDLSGRVITIVGDIRHSRVFGSLVRIIKAQKGVIRVSSPQTLLPVEIEKFGLEVFYKIEDALDGADVVYALRIQEERGAQALIPSLREYSKLYGITRKRLDMAKPDAILMHPGPVRREVDIHSALVALDNQSHILNQVENGLAVRKALLWLLGNRMDGKVKERILL